MHRSEHAMVEVAILTPDPAVDAFAGLWEKVMARLQAALTDSGIATVVTPWTAHVEHAEGLLGHAHVLPLLVWGYHEDHARWLQACRTWERDGVRLSNPADILAWNSDKRYLSELEARGIAVPATTWTDQVTQATVDAFFEATGADELIVKPTVSGGAWKTRRVRRGEVVDAAAGATMLIQPYLSTIESEGETSLLYFGGHFSHALNKRPPVGEFRVQEQFGGTYSLLDVPPAGALALAEQTLAAVDAPLLYARIDVVPDASGRWLLMEAELIEPDFYLGVDPQRGAGFARALRKLL